MSLLIDAEMKSFHGLRTPVIFIQNVITDLILGLGMKELFGCLPSMFGSGTRPTPVLSP